MGVDMLKVEFPGDVDSPEAQEAALAACSRLDAGIDVSDGPLRPGLYGRPCRLVRAAAAPEHWYREWHA